jgi:hydroxymethylglutaryl-CoA synthase
VENINTHIGLCSWEGEKYCEPVYNFTQPCQGGGMKNRFVSAVGAYLPLLRLERAVAARALKFSGLGGRTAGYRAMSSWDEDAVTLATEAARGLAEDVGSIIFASTSAPFTERSHAALLSEALALPPAVRTNDVAGTRRCAVSALLSALLGSETTLVAAGEARSVQAGHPLHLAYGDGGAAARVSDAGAARLVGHASCSHDFVDLYASREHPSPYTYEERFVRETAVREIIVPTIKRACSAAGVEPERIAFAAVHEPVANCWCDISKATGITAPNLSSDLALTAGDLGTAHIIFAFAMACNQSKPGDIILLAGFGSGCDALLFEMTDTMPGADAAAAMLKTGCITHDYVRFLSLTGALDLDWGVRAEVDQKAQATVIERHSRDVIGFVGGQDSRGNVQFPKSRIPVHPDATGPERLTDVRLADLPGRLVSVTADRLNFSPDPPFWFGLVQFENGARLMMEFTDADARGFTVGDKVQMRLRIKSHDKRRGFRTYFWKAAPYKRPDLEG